MHQRIERFGFYYGFPVFFMTTKDRTTGADDLTPLSSSWTLGNTMVIGIGQGNKAFKIWKRARRRRSACPMTRSMSS